MERIKLFAMMLLLSVAAFSQDAKQVLDKAAAVVSNAKGVQAQFTMKNSQLNASGTIAIKGKKFHAAVPQAIVWFDGKTQWTYMKKNDEVNVANPTQADLEAISPYSFIYLYKQGYSYTMKKKPGNYEVHLTAKKKKHGIQEMYIVVNQKTYIPSQIRLKQQKGWTTIDISHFKQVALSDETFRFNAKDYPTAEVIDLR